MSTMEDRFTGKFVEDSVPHGTTFLNYDIANPKSILQFIREEKEAWTRKIL